MGIQIAVIGPDSGELLEDSGTLLLSAEKVGELAARKGAILFTGGMGGVMEEACKGAKRAGGLTVGIPGNVRGISNSYVDIEIVSEMDVGSFQACGMKGCDAVIVFPGGAGTLSEVCIAYRYAMRIIVMKGFSEYYDGLVGRYMDAGKKVLIMGADSPEEAVEKALEAGI